MDSPAFEIKTLNPRDNPNEAEELTYIHRAEQLLYEDVLPDKFIEGETDDGEPIWAVAEDELGPELDVEKKLEQHKPVFEDLALAYQECLGERGRFSFRIDGDSYNYFGDAAAIDNYFLPSLSRDASTILKLYEVRTFVLYYQGKYYGHVWYFTNSNYPEFCGIYGMKTSLVNLLYNESCSTSRKSSHRRGIALRLLRDAVYPTARAEGRKNIIVPWPLPPMIPILQREGFVEHNTSELNDVRRFLSKLTGTSNYFSKGL